MRKFVIEEQSKEWLFDLDGNVYHPNLRDKIEKGMAVGLRLTEREIPSNERINIIDKFKNYNKLHKEYSEYHESENQRKEDLKKEISKIIVEFEGQKESLKQEKEKIEKEISDLKEHTKDEEKNKQQFKEKMISFGKELGKINKNLRDKERHIANLKEATKHNPDYKKRYLIDEHNFDKELFEDRFDYDKFEDLENLFFEVPTKDRPWCETIFFKVVKRVGDKLYGDVLSKFRRKNSKCPLKDGDRISFYAKNIFLVPSILNKRSKLKSYLQTDFSYKFFRSNRITDWDGVFLDLKSRELIGRGSTVRFQLKEANHSSNIHYAIILKQEGKYFWGEILDYYIVIEEKITDPVKTGCIYKFSKESITEIPIMWNKHLLELEKYKNRENFGYPITGYRLDDNYYDLEELQ